MAKIKIGIYIFSNKIKKRETKNREKFFDGQNYIGVRYLISELNMKNIDIKYVSSLTINTVDYVLIPIISYYDLINLINELHNKKIKSKIIVGGPGLLNIKLIRDIADIAILGRAENKINDIILKNNICGAWYKDDNYDFKKNIKIFELEKYIEIDDPILGKYKEKSIGCNNKCYFCEYSWKNKYKSKTNIYDSGLADRETMFKELDWSVYKNKDLVTAIDGITENTRKIIGKPISNNDIEKKILEIDKQKKNYFSLKLYCLLGYPFEDGFYPEELIKVISKISKKTKNRLNIAMVSPHFMPMPLTPMENEPVNTVNFREKIKNYDFSIVQKHNIKLYWPYSLSSSPINALESTIINRCYDAEMIKKILCSNQYKSLSVQQKIKIIKKYFENYIGKYDNVLPFISRAHDTQKAKARYNELKSKY